METPLKTNYFTPVVDAAATCRGCLFPRPPPDHAPPTGSTPIRQVHIIHVDDPEGGAVEVVLAGKKKRGADSQEATPTPQDMPTSPETPMSRVALVLHSSRGKAPVVFTVTAQGIQNHTKSIFLVSVAEGRRGGGGGGAGAGEGRGRGGAGAGEGAEQGAKKGRRRDKGGSGEGREGVGERRKRGGAVTKKKMKGRKKVQEKETA